jgi:hypothetical protein
MSVLRERMLELAIVTGSVVSMMTAGRFGSLLSQLPLYVPPRVMVIGAL